MLWNRPWIISLLLLCLSACHKGQHKYQGYVEAENLYLASPNAGVLKKLLVDRGYPVKKGQILFVLDANPQILILKQNEANLMQAQKILRDLEKPLRSPEINAIQAQIEQADAKLALAAIRVRRLEELYQKKATDKDSLDAAIANYKEIGQLKAQLESQLALAKLGSRDERIKAQQAKVNAVLAQVEEAKWQLAQKTIAAPANGVVYDKYYNEGEFVSAEHPVLVLLPDANKKIIFFIPSRDLTAVRVGQKIQFICYSCEHASTAIISYVAPQAEYIPPLVYSRENSDKLVFRIEARLEQPAEFKPGQPVSVTI